jgi:protein gp37
VSDHSNIEWTDATWNPTTGCTKVSPGCANCYIERTPAFRIAGRRFERGHIPLLLHENRLEQPLHWRKPRRVFVNSLSDLFHDDVPDAFIDRVFAVMALCQQHTFQVLTKRPRRMRLWMQRHEQRHPNHVNVVLPDPVRPEPAIVVVERARKWPLPNVWLGVSIENQRFADERFPLICELGEAGWNTMVSLEPLLGRVVIPARYLALGSRAWLVEGGESGKNSRRHDIEWARAIYRQATAAGVAFFEKQLGANAEVQHGCGDCDPCASGQRCSLGYNVRMELRHKKGGDIAEFPPDLQIREFP